MSHAGCIQFAEEVQQERDAAIAEREELRLRVTLLGGQLYSVTAERDRYREIISNEMPWLLAALNPPKENK